MQINFMNIISIFLAFISGIAVPILGYILKGQRDSTSRLWKMFDEHRMSRNLHPGKEALANLEKLFKVEMEHLTESIKDIKKLIEGQE